MSTEDLKQKIEQTDEILVYGYLKNYYVHFAFRMFQPGHVASVLYASSAPLTPLFRC